MKARNRRRASCDRVAGAAAGCGAASTRRAMRRRRSRSSSRSPRTATTRRRGSRSPMRSPAVARSVADQGAPELARHGNGSPRSPTSVASSPTSVTKGAARDRRRPRLGHDRCRQLPGARRAVPRRQPPARESRASDAVRAAGARRGATRRRRRRRAAARDGCAGRSASTDGSFAVGDYRGARIAIRPSRVAALTFRALAARPAGYIPGDSPPSTVPRSTRAPSARRGTTRTRAR